VDICEKEDRDAIFRKAGTRNLPIVFIDDKYVGDYDALVVLDQNGKLDGLLAMNGVRLVSEAEHLARLKSHDQETKKPGAEVAVGAGGKPAATGGGAAPAKSTPSKANACAKCGAPKTGAKFCAECGNKH